MLLTRFFIKTSFVVGCMPSSTPFQGESDQPASSLMSFLWLGLSPQMAMEIQVLLVFEFFFMSCLFLFKIVIAIVLGRPKVRLHSFCICSHIYLDANMDVFSCLQLVLVSIFLAKLIRGFNIYTRFMIM